MKKQDLQTKLFDSGLVEKGVAQNILSFKQDHREAYQKDYQKQYKNKRHQKLLSFTPEEMGYLQEKADQHEMKLSPFMKATMFAYINASFVFPSQRSLTNIETLLRQLNNRVSESLAYVHLSKDVTLHEIQTVKTQVSQVESFIRTTLERPPRLEKWLEEQMEDDELFLPKLLSAIAKIIA